MSPQARSKQGKVWADSFEKFVRANTAGCIPNEKEADSRYTKAGASLKIFTYPTLKSLLLPTDFVWKSRKGVLYPGCWAEKQITANETQYVDTHACGLFVVPPPLIVQLVHNLNYQTGPNGKYFVSWFSWTSISNPQTGAVANGEPSTNCGHACYTMFHWGITAQKKKKDIYGGSDGKPWRLHTPVLSAKTIEAIDNFAKKILCECPLFACYLLSVGLYGQLTMGSMQKTVDLMMEHTGFGRDSSFIDTRCLELFVEKGRRKFVATPLTLNKTPEKLLHMNLPPLHVKKYKSSAPSWVQWVILPQH